MKPFLLSMLAALLCPVWLATAAPDAVTEPPVLSAAAAKALPQLDQAAAPIAQGFTIFLIGDSTMANKPLIPENPERGWGVQDKFLNYSERARGSLRLAC